MKTIETKMRFCKSVSRWASLWLLAFGIFLAGDLHHNMKVRDLSSGQERVYPLNLEVSRIYSSGPGWMPDGRSVLVAGGENQRQGPFLYRVDLASGKAEEVGRGDVVTGFKASPDGKSVFYQGGGNSQQLARFDLDTRQAAVLREVVPFFPQKTSISSPAISRDGKRVAFVESTVDGRRSEILVTNVTGSETRVIFRSATDEIDRYNALAWAADDRHILFVMLQSIWRVPVNGGEAERLGMSMKARIKGPQMHPDGRTIFFTAVGDGTGDQIWALENFLQVTSAR
jgi:Tol biopolymer transport system component